MSKIEEIEASLKALTEKFKLLLSSETDTFKLKVEVKKSEE